jgi:hypothetical protein
VPVTIRIGESQRQLNNPDATQLAEQLLLAAQGLRGEVDDPQPIIAVSDAIARRLDGRESGPVEVTDRVALDALFAVLNALVHENDSPAMDIYKAVAAARAA